jgi:hypothetical protein
MGRYGKPDEELGSWVGEAVWADFLSETISAFETQDWVGCKKNTNCCVVSLRRKGALVLHCPLSCSVRTAALPQPANPS